MNPAAPVSMPIYLAAVAQTEEPIHSPGIIELMMTADAVVQLVLLVLVAMSVVCWVIIFNKFNLIRHATANTDTFLDCSGRVSVSTRCMTKPTVWSTPPSRRCSRPATSSCPS